MVSSSRRLSILTTQEIDDLFGLPHFTENDRRFFCDLSPAERDLVDSVYTISVAVHLILQRGHFKAKRQFFVYTREEVIDDLEHIRHRYFPARDIVEIKMLSKPTRLEQQQVILKLFDYHFHPRPGTLRPSFPCFNSTISTNRSIPAVTASVSKRRSTPSTPGMAANILG